MLQFGQQNLSATYIERPGAYGIIIGANNQIGLVKVPLGFYLVGGGIDPNERPEESLLREIKEEIGYEAQIIQKIGMAAQFLYASKEDTYFKKIGNFYTIKLTEKIETNSEDDHHLVWMNKEEAKSKVLDEYLAWAIDQIS